jgi:RNA polymerase sigma-B factor
LESSPNISSGASTTSSTRSRRAAHHASSLDAPRQHDDDEAWPLIESLGEEDERIDDVEASLSIAAAARCLAARERKVLHLRYGAELTQSEIATRIGVSQMQVLRILRSATVRLRELTGAP